MSKPRQCSSCGGFCGGGYTDKGGRYHYCKAGDYPAPPAPLSDRERELVEAAAAVVVADTEAAVQYRYANACAGPSAAAECKARFLRLLKALAKYD